MMKRFLPWFPLLLGALALPHTHAATYQAWQGANSNWNDPANWASADVPDTATEIASFATAGVKDVRFTASTTIGGMASQTKYSITNGPYDLNVKSGNISINGTLIQESGGRITLSGTAGQNSGTTLQVNAGGTLQFLDQSSAGKMSIVLDGNMIIQTTTSSLYLGSLNGSGSISFESAGNTSARQITISSGEFFGTIKDGTATGSLVLGGSSIFLSGANTYSGGTKIGSGTVTIGRNADITDPSASALGTGLVSIASTASLLFRNNTHVSGSVTLTGGTIGSIATGQTAAGKLTLGGDLTLGSKSMLQIAWEQSGSYSQLTVDGQLTLGGSLKIDLGKSTSPILGQVMYIVDRTGNDISSSGAFANAPNGIFTDPLGNTYAVNYAANDPANNSPASNDISLTVTSIVPEPSSLVLISSFLFLQTTRRKKPDHY